MVKHIVMFRIKETDKSKEENVDMIANELAALKDKISEIKAIDVRKAENSGANAWDIVLVSDFENFEDLKAYNDHPEHLKVVALLKEVRRELGAVVDYTY